MLHFDWKKIHDFIWKFRLKAPPSLTMGTLAVMLKKQTQLNLKENWTSENYKEINEKNMWHISNSFEFDIYCQCTDV
jgi:hypothetical protein